MDQRARVNELQFHFQLPVGILWAAGKTMPGVGLVNFFFGVYGIIEHFKENGFLPENGILLKCLSTFMLSLVHILFTHILEYWVSPCEIVGLVNKTPR